MQEIVDRVDALLGEGRIEDVIKQVNQLLLDIFTGNSSQDYFAELLAIRGMAFYRRKNFEDARTDFRFSLSTDPANERAIYGMAYLAAYVDKDVAKTHEWMEKLPDSAARDNAWMIIMRSNEYISSNGPLSTDIEVADVLAKYLAPNPADPLNTANLMHNAGRFFLAESEYHEKDGDIEEARIDRVSAVAALSLSLALYGTGEINLHHRAAANYWMSVAMEKVLGPAAAIPSACESLKLWHKQLLLDQGNPHYQKSYNGSRERLIDLCEKGLADEMTEKGPGPGNYQYNLLQAADDTLAVTRIEPPTND